MAESNPIVEAEKSGLVYTNSESEQSPYIFVKLSPSKDDPESYDIGLEADGLTDVQTFHILETLVEQLRGQVAPPRRPAGF
jgi:hypothetical protein